MKNYGRKEYPKDLRWVEEISRLMDSKFRLPGTRFRFGLDPIIGLLPVVGDVVTLAISGGLVLYMIKYGASGKVIVLMLINLFLDATIGSIPIIGSIFDFFYKSNTRNINLLKKYYQEEKYQGSGIGIILLVAFILLAFIFLLLWGLWELLVWLW
ncbi:DUF4112 domain-containing protein [Nafulsella turpanensis]|uniref:DUF4112 domain-containing protein n=1 Tax=Nafulsella turpanensis TaxID=1265690 RepID=UPI00037BD5C4|nr:DUF4112 domain-containing protein [Nafulsella turpanensis]